MANSKFVTGYSGPELDLAIMRREVDGRVTTGETMTVRSPEWLDKGLVDVHAGIEIPKGKKNPRFAQLPELESFAKTEREKKLLEVFRAFRLAGQNFSCRLERLRIAPRFFRMPCARL